MKQLSPIDILVTRQRQTWFWFVLFLTAVVGFVWERQRLVALLASGPRFVIVDDNAFYLPKSLDFASATDLHVSQVTLAMETLLDRNPAGLDHPERLSRLFSRTATGKARRLSADEGALFSGRKLHQKVETGDIQLLQVDADSVLATARGQLIRNGVFDGEPFAEVLAVNARFTFARNPDMLLNGAFPTVVTHFELEIQSPQS